VDLLDVVAVWLHTVAFVIAWGYYGVLGRVILPALEHSLDREDAAATAIAVERRAVPLIVLSMVLFGATGTYLLVSDPEYAGLGAFFATGWTTLMLVKHLVIVGFVAAAVIVDRLVRSLAESSGSSSLTRVRVGAEVTTGLGALIALLTAAAQLTS
jgi:uncharacterized membrane protein